MKKLFYERILPTEKQIPSTPEYESTTELFDVVKEELCDQMSESARMMFTDYENYAERLTMLQNEECFKHGMAMGIRIAAEAFLMDEQSQSEANTSI